MIRGWSIRFGQGYWTAAPFIDINHSHSHYKSLLSSSFYVSGLTLISLSVSVDNSWKGPSFNRPTPKCMSTRITFSWCCNARWQQQLWTHFLWIRATVDCLRPRCTMDGRKWNNNIIGVGHKLQTTNVVINCNCDCVFSPIASFVVVDSVVVVGAFGRRKKTGRRNNIEMRNNMAIGDY